MNQLQILEKVGITKEMLVELKDRLRHEKEILMDGVPYPNGSIANLEYEVAVRKDAAATELLVALF